MTTIVVLSLVPNRYKSEATLLVVQQQVPQRYVVPNSTTDTTSELQAMKQEILSRSHLHEIVRKFGLYSNATRRMVPEQIVELMLRDIEIQTLESAPRGKDFDAFTISFTAESPVVAQQVTSTLTSLFIQENLKTREEQATNTTSFLDEQLEAAKTKLAEQEERLRDFKTQYLGELPEQQQGNLGILTSLQTQLQNVMASMSRAQEQRVYLESLLSGYQARDRALAIGSSAPWSGSSDARRIVNPIESARADLTRLQSERATLLSRLTVQHPDVVKVTREIAEAEGVLERLKVSPPNNDEAATRALLAGGTKTQPVVSVDPVDEPAVAQIKSQLEANRLEMENLSKDEAKFKAGLVQYEKRLNLTPVREQQLTGILREYDLQKQNYSDLLSKELQSKLATNLEKQQGGQQFRLIDPPSRPVVPASPKRLKINLASAAGGLFLGFAMAFLVDMRDQSFHTEKQLSQRFSVPLVVGVPLLLTPKETRTRIWKGSFEWIAGCLLTLAVCVAEFYACRQS
jgi:polysaccharide chain length determinant protein (PEP-CTERM system associated)